jgi:serine/threonine-protein kinase
MNSVLPEPLAEGRYQLIEVIGEGGMATVYRAWDQRLQRPRAIKLLSPALAIRPNLRRRFVAEAQTMATLEESRVVRVFDIQEDGDRVFIVMELVEGGSLLDRVRTFGRLPPRLAALVTAQIAEALHVAHQAGVIHRDIKPHNILLTRSGEVRITDFGIAQVQHETGDGVTRTGAVLGTWGFMAPEQKSNAKAVDARADIYSLGATLWSLVRDDTPPELFMSDREAHMLEALPVELAAIVARATKYRREERYPSARAMAEALRANLETLPPDPEGTPPLVPPDLEPLSSSAPVDTILQIKPDSEVPGTMVPEDVPRAEKHATSPEGTFAEEPEPEPPAAKAGAPSWLLIPVLGAASIAGILVFMNRDPEPAPQATVAPAVAPVVKVEPPPPPPEVVTTPPPEPPVQAPAVTTPQVRTPKSKEAPVSASATSPPPETVPARAAAISHQPPAGAVMGQSVVFSAEIQGDWKVVLYYRPASGGAFRERAMTGSGGNWSASVRVEEAFAGGIQYFIKATASGGRTAFVGGPTRPMSLTVSSG